jgi:hypothetical protein
MAKFSPVYNSEGYLLYFSNTSEIKTCLKKWCHIERQGKQSENGDFRQIIFPPEMYKLIRKDSQKSSKKFLDNKVFAFCLRHFKKEYRESIASGKVKPCAEHVNKAGFIPLKTESLEHTYQDIIKNLIIRNDAVNDGASRFEGNAPESVVDHIGLLLDEALNSQAPQVHYSPPPARIDLDLFTPEMPDFQHQEEQYQQQQQQQQQQQHNLMETNFEVRENTPATSEVRENVQLMTTSITVQNLENISFENGTMVFEEEAALTQQQEFATMAPQDASSFTSQEPIVVDLTSSSVPQAQPQTSSSSFSDFGKNVSSQFFGNIIIFLIKF